jgi:hypothetical protein
MGRKGPLAEKLAAAFLVLLAASALASDAIEMKTGERVEGVFKEATSAGVVILVGGQPLTIPLEKVRAIYLGASQTAQPSTAEVSLEALKGLRSVTQAGISYAEYSRRVLDAKVLVDKYLSSTNPDDAKRAAIRLAMKYYEVASQLWNNKIIRVSDAGTFMSRSTDLGRELVQDEELRSCIALRRFVEPLWLVSVRAIEHSNRDQTDQQKLDSQYQSLGSALSGGLEELGVTMASPLPVMWSCAATKIDELEQAGGTSR